MNKQKGIMTMKKAAAILIMFVMLVFAAPASNLIADIEVTLLENDSPVASSSLDGLILPFGADIEPAALNLSATQIGVTSGHRYLVRSLNGSSFGKGAFNASLMAMVALNVADYFSTNAALKYPGASESNPLLKPFVKSPVAFAAVKIGFTAISYLTAKTLFKKNRTMAWIVTMVGNAALSYAVSSNMRMASAAKNL
jgi:hypothetical protein